MEMDNVEKNVENEELKPEQNEFFGGIVQSYEPELVLASPRLVKTVVNELEKLRADLIGLSDPRQRRRFLPQVQDYLSYLSGDVTTLQLQQMSDMIDVIRALMISAALERISTRSGM